MAFRLNDAIAMAKAEKRIANKKELALKLWPDSPAPLVAQNNLSNLISGKSKTIPIDYVAPICKVLGVSADYLFGIDE